MVSGHRLREPVRIFGIPRWVCRTDETTIPNQEKLTMTKQISKKPVAIAMGAALTGGLLAAGTANAAANPFALSEMGSGYMQMAEGKCGGNKAEEAKCGGKAEEAKCGGKAEEAKCGGKAEEAKCGAKPKAEEGKCGEGKCGGSK
jgi:uncharacterized low-complexity protein